MRWILSIATLCWKLLNPGVRKEKERSRIEIQEFNQVKERQKGLKWIHLKKLSQEKKGIIQAPNKDLREIHIQNIF